MVASWLLERADSGGEASNFDFGDERFSRESLLERPFSKAPVRCASDDASLEEEDFARECGSEALAEMGPR
jgi:hypothetical protein